MVRALSAAAPSYAPAGRSLIAASALGLHGDEGDAVRQRLAELHGCNTASWELLRVDAIPAALPFTPPPWPSNPPLELDGVLVAGDHVATPSIQGAMASGARAARRVLDR